MMVYPSSSVTARPERAWRISNPARSGTLRIYIIDNHPGVTTNPHLARGLSGSSTDCFKWTTPAAGQAAPSNRRSKHHSI